MLSKIRGYLYNINIPRRIQNLDQGRLFPSKDKKWAILAEGQCEKCNTMTFGTCEECGKWVCVECADLTGRCLEC